MTIFHHTQTVRFSDTDAAGIVYFGAFASYFDESFLAALRKKQLGWNEHREYNFLLPIVEQQIKFFHPLRVGEVFDVTMQVEKLSNRSFKTHHKIYLTSSANVDVVAEGTISRVVVHYDNFKPMKIPELLRNVLQSYADD